MVTGLISSKNAALWLLLLYENATRGPGALRRGAALTPNVPNGHLQESFACGPPRAAGVKATHSPMRVVLSGLTCTIHESRTAAPLTLLVALNAVTVYHTGPNTSADMPLTATVRASPEYAVPANGSIVAS